MKFIAAKSAILRKVSDDRLIKSVASHRLTLEPFVTCEPVFNAPRSRTKPCLRKLGCTLECLFAVLPVPLKLQQRRPAGSKEFAVLHVRPCRRPPLLVRVYLCPQSSPGRVAVIFEMPKGRNRGDRAEARPLCPAGFRTEERDLRRSAAKKNDLLWFHAF